MYKFQLQLTPAHTHGCSLSPTCTQDMCLPSKCMHTTSFTVAQICICQRNHHTHHLKYAHGTSAPPLRHTANEHLSFTIRSLEIHMFEPTFAQMCSDLHAECLLCMRVKKALHMMLHSPSHACNPIFSHRCSLLFPTCVAANNLNLFLPMLLNMQMWIAHQD